MTILLYIAGMLALGLGVGMFSAALGLGGGLIMVPAFLTFVDGMDANTAKGTSLCIIFFVALLNTWRLHRDDGHYPWGKAAWLAAGSLAGGFFGAWVTTLLPERAVLWVFMAFLGIVALRTFFIEPPAVSEGHDRRRILVSIAIGLFAGAFGGATGTGGGALLIPLVLLAGIATNRRVAGLSNMVMVATSAAGTVAHLAATPVFDRPWTIGAVYLPLVPLVFLGAQVASPWGKRVNEALTLHWRRTLMGAFLLVIALRILYRLLG